MYPAREYMPRESSAAAGDEAMTISVAIAMALFDCLTF
jgi:hypothetical protein